MMAFTAFVDPLSAGSNWWFLMLLPLALGIALVYKTMRCELLAEVPKQTAIAFAKLLGAFLGCAAVLWIVLLILERRG